MSGAAGNAAHQGLDIATGDQDKFSYGQLGISAGLGAGLGYAGAKLSGPIQRGLSRLFGKGKFTIEVGPTRVVNSTQTAEQANAAAAASGAKPPYAPGTEVYNETLTSTEQFVRVYTEGVTNMEGRWVMAASEIEGLTPVQIQNKFALPNLPNRVADATVEAGTAVETSTAGAIEGWGQGGGNQVKVLGNATFSNPRELPTGGN